MSSMPWLSPRKKTVTLMDANPDGSLKADQMKASEEEMSAAEEILSAIAMKDAKALAIAIKAAFQIMDAEPHVEGEHL